MLITEHGGSHGVRASGLLESALSRPVNLFSYGNPDLPALAAADAAGIIKNHPFIDGNKRTGFAAAATFLDSNGLELTAPEAEATRMTLDLAAGTVSEDEYAAWLRENTRPA
jgi:death-on-curing protein